MDYGINSNKDLKFLPTPPMEATITNETPQSREANVVINDAHAIDKHSNYNNTLIINTLSGTNATPTYNNITLHSMLTDITTMGEEFLYCAKSSFQSHNTSHLTDATCESDAKLNGSAISTPSIDQSASLSCNASAETYRSVPSKIMPSITQTLPPHLLPCMQIVALM